MKRVNEIEEDNFYGDQEKQPIKKNKIEFIEIKREKWKLFYKLASSLEYYEELEEKSKYGIVTFEYNEFLAKRYKIKMKQSRYFLVIPYEEFKESYFKIPKVYRNFYELIFDSPCKLYFDCEFYTICNQEKNGKEAIEKLIYYLTEKLADLNINLERKDIIDLDSSTDEKFSRHLIIHLKGFDGRKYAFKNSLCIKDFVRDFVNGITDEDLFCKQEDKGDLLFPIIDLAVYSKNRSFRIYKSSKLNKDVYLEPSQENQFQFSDAKELLMKSLICTSDYDELIQYEHKEMNHTNILTCNTNTHELLAIDDVINEWIQDGRDNIGSISKIIDLKDTIVYYVKNYRFCENIQRPHKSNSIYFVVNKQRRTIYHKCFDPDCSGFRSNERLIPDHLFLKDTKI